MSDTLAAPAAYALEARHSRFLARAAYRSSDDGEPAGTAGRPILAAIDGQDCDRVMVVVTRWFGGTKLGAGGLVRAYGGAAAECLRIASRVPLVAMRTLQLQAGFDDIGAVHAALAGFGAQKLEEAFAAEGLHLRLSLPADRAEALQAHLRDATRDRVRFALEPGAGQEQFRPRAFRAASNPGNGKARG